MFAMFILATQLSKRHMILNRVRVKAYAVFNSPTDNVRVIRSCRLLGTRCGRRCNNPSIWDSLNAWHCAKYRSPRIRIVVLYAAPSGVGSRPFRSWLDSVLGGKRVFAALSSKKPWTSWRRTERHRHGNRQVACGWL